ncbi:hypothetical protein EMCRGX_G000557 [Ephydatia muelleri]|eukprot:Em0001g407a
MELHWKAPLQPKGFLKILEWLFAFLATILVGTYNFSETAPCPQVYSLGNCPGNVTFSVAYPFDSVSVGHQCVPGYTVITPPSNRTVIYPIFDFGLSDSIQSGAQFFVVWGSATLFYSVIAILIYILLTANKGLEQIMSILIWVDLGFTVFWAFMWFVASVVWATYMNQLKNEFNSHLTNPNNDETSLIGCGGVTPTTISLSGGSLVQAAIAVVFGFTNVLLWGANIYWVLIDTAWYIQWKGDGGGFKGFSKGSSRSTYDTI